MIWLNFFSDIRWINAEPAQFGCGSGLGPPPWARTAFWWPLVTSHLFGAYEKLTAPMLAAAAKSKRGRKK
jgi:hypothetical protein